MHYAMNLNLKLNPILLVARNWQQMQFEPIKSVITNTNDTVRKLLPVNPASVMTFIIFF